MDIHPGRSNFLPAKPSFDDKKEEPRYLVELTEEEVKNVGEGRCNYRRIYFRGAFVAGGLMFLSAILIPDTAKILQMGVILIIGLLAITMILITGTKAGQASKVFLAKVKEENSEKTSHLKPFGSIQVPKRD